MAQITTPYGETATDVSGGAAGVADALLERVVLVRGGWGSGSGVIWSSDGLIITNSHVVQGDDAQVVLRSGERIAAKLVARDAEHDLAALEVDRRGLPAATPGDSSRVRVGQLVLAVGNPMGLRNVVTAGIVLGTGQIGAEAGMRLRNLIRADVALAPGNSGGPLADADGRVLGINAMISSVGMALAIPTATVEQFLLFNRKNRPYIGVAGVPVEMRVAGAARRGLLLTTIEAGSPAEQAGLLQADVLVAFDGQDVATGEQFQSRLFARQPGDAVRMAVLRAQQPAEFTVIPTERVAV